MERNKQSLLLEFLESKFACISQEAEHGAQRTFQHDDNQPRAEVQLSAYG